MRLMCFTFNLDIRFFLKARHDFDMHKLSLLLGYIGAHMDTDPIRLNHSLASEQLISDIYFACFAKIYQIRC